MRGKETNGKTAKKMESSWSVRELLEKIEENLGLDRER